MSAGFAYDVFLSYSQADAKWVRGELLARLERAKLKVCIDYRDFEAGAVGWPGVVTASTHCLSTAHRLSTAGSNHLRPETEFLGET